ncbi:MAG: hypothetical protein AAF722_02465 [Cyanobacteria bacterium P01_C01_bin.70]
MFSNKHEFIEHKADFKGEYSPSEIALNAEFQVLEEMIAAGKISPMQRTIIMHDQAATGRTIAEILIIRGWL